MAGRPVTVGELRRLAATFGPLPWVGELVIEPPTVVDPGVANPDIPAQAPTLPIGIRGAEYVWNDVSNWAQDAWHAAAGLFGSVVSVTVTDVQNLIDTALHYDITAWSSFVNILQGTLAAVTSAAFNDIINLTTYAGDGFAYVIDFAQSLADYVGGVLEAEIQGIEGEITGLEDFIGAAVAATAGAIEAWAIDNIYHPLLDEIQRLTHDVVVDIADTIAGIESWVGDQINAETLARIAALAGLAALVGSLATTVTEVTTFVDECGQPMCDVMGPKTDLGKFLKALNLVTDAALLAELASLDANGIENLIRGMVRLGGGIVDDIDAIFAGGLNLGEALARTGA